MRRNIFAKTASALLAALTVLLFFVFPVKAEFRYTPIKAQIPVVVDYDKSDKEKYEIVIEKLDKAAPTPSKSTVVFNGAGSENIGIKIDEPGTFKYKIYEKTGDNEKIEYDDTTYTVTLFVTQDKKGNLESKVILSKGKLLKPTAVKFANKAVEDHKHKPILPATGEKLSKLVPYGVAALLIGGLLLILAFKRRKEETDA